MDQDCQHDWALLSRGKYWEKSLPTAEFVVELEIFFCRHNPSHRLVLYSCDSRYSFMGKTEEEYKVWLEEKIREKKQKK